ncbi:MAG: type II toxin-antitoxin system VapB family antitoxin [Victivallaceae bacterium]|nr:type II toxin-antitoxin system VapB family antitoxin [Victivallaceae bacterium]
MTTAKIFMSGRSQAVRLPKQFRLSGSEVAIRKVGDEVILPPISRKEALKAFLDLPGCPDFAVDREDSQKVFKVDVF